MQLPIEEYFKYHPPITPERIALHDRVNQDSLEICKAFIESKNDVESLAIRDAAILLADEVCLDKTCNDLAKRAVEKASKTAASYVNKDIKIEAILMYIQQFRMFLNQGITVDDLKLKRQELAVEYHPHSSDSRHPKSAYTAKSIDIEPPSSMSKYFEHQKPEMMSFHVKDGEILSIEPLYKGVHLTLDGDKWRAQIQGFENYDDFADSYQNGLERIRVDALDRVDQFNKLSAGESIKRWDSDINGFLRLQVDRTTEATEHQGKTIDVSMPNFHSIDRDEYVLGGWEQI